MVRHAVNHLEESQGSELRMIRVIAKLRQRQLQLARQGKVEESARYAQRVYRVAGAAARATCPC